MVLSTDLKIIHLLVLRIPVKLQHTSPLLDNHEMRHPDTLTSPSKNQFL